ncbi:MAG: 2'-5' RNA ligase family protein [Patescibacteria group bacterium]|nr:2'-5' RNA ligase family protein [Patescibacteria group bacterium]
MIVKYECISAQFKITGPLVKQIRDFTKTIPQNVIVKKDTSDPHLTLRYGILPSSARKVDLELKHLLRSENSVTVTLGRTSYFSAMDSNIGDVVVILAVSSDLMRLARVITRHLQVKKTEHTEYVPHITLAYVVPGSGKQFAGRSDFFGKKVTFNSVELSMPDGKRYLVKMGTGK